MGSWGFFIDFIFLAALYSCVRLSLYQKWVPGVSPGRKSTGGAYSWQPFHFRVL